MRVGQIMNDRNNKTSICSIVFLDIIDYSKKTDSEQIEIKNQFNALINHAIKDVAENDRIILDTGDGAAIASNGSPEDVLFIALNIRDEILNSNIHSASPLYVRFGVNLGPVRVVKDINGRPNIIGDGINVAQRVMSFAEPNQILVSRSYYEVTSRLTQEISQMFDYSGVKQDKHVREHEVYSVRLQKELAENAENNTLPMDTIPDTSSQHTKLFNWKYAALAAPALVAFVLIIKAANEPVTPKIILNASVDAVQTNAAKTDSTEKSQKLATLIPDNVNKSLLMPNETLEVVPQSTSTKSTEPAKDIALNGKTQEDLLKAELTQKKAKQKAKKKADEATAQKNAVEAKVQNATVVNGAAVNGTGVNRSVVNKPNMQHQEVVVAKTEAKKESVRVKSGREKSGWSTFKDSVKQGGENKCSQAQIAMNQCN